MLSNSTLENQKGLKMLHDDIVQAIKFDLGDEFSGMPGFAMKEDRISVPKLPYNKVYFEVVSSDLKRYGAIFEDFEDQGVCGQMLSPAIAAHDSSIDGLFPTGVAFTQLGDDLKVHLLNKTDKLKDIEVAAIIALDLMVKAIGVINCSNVTTIDSRENKFINMKRKKKGKLPLFTYKTLHLSLDDKEVNRTGNKGSHASPRVHLRRGHIRRLNSLKSVWVQSCVVGDKSKGVIHKDYAIH